MEQWIVFYQHIEPVHTLALTDNKDGHAKYVEMQTAGHVDAKYVPLKVAEAAPDLLENLERIIDRIEETEMQGNFPSALKRAKDAIAKAKEKNV